MSPLGFKARVGCLIHIAEANVLYVPQDPLLVLHLLTSWPVRLRWGYRDSNPCSQNICEPDALPTELNRDRLMNAYLPYMESWWRADKFPVWARMEMMRGPGYPAPTWCAWSPYPDSPSCKKTKGWVFTRVSPVIFCFQGMIKMASTRPSPVVRY